MFNGWFYIRTLRDPVQAKAMKEMGLGDPELFIEKKVKFYFCVNLTRMATFISSEVQKSIKWRNGFIYKADFHIKEKEDKE